MKHLYWILLLFVTPQLFAQNQLNEQGRKDGNWTVKAGDLKKIGYAPEAIYEEGLFENGRKVGVWKTYYPSGKLKETITFVAGRPRGPYVCYYENGKIEEKGNWNLTKNYGKFVRYYQDGTLHQEFNFEESGLRSGAQKYYHPNGKIALEGNWQSGKEMGEIKEFDDTGALSSTRFYNEGKMDESKTTFIQTKQIIPPKPIQNETKQIPIPVAADQEKLTSNIGVFNGNGQHTLYNRDKQIAQKGIFKDGRLYEGKRYKYDKNGLLIQIEIYQSGKYIGNGPIEEGMK